MRICWHMPMLRRAGCGLSYRALQFAKGLADQGWSTTFVVEQSRCDFPEGDSGTISVRLLPDESRTAPHWSLQSLTRTRAARHLIPAIHRIEHDLFVSCNPEAIAAYGAARKRAPVVFVCGGTTILHDGADRARQAELGIGTRTLFAIDRRLKHQAEKAAFHAADAIVFDSVSTKDRVIDSYRVHPAKCHAIYGGVDADRFRPGTSAQRAAARHRLSIPPGAFIAACVGRLSPEKNLESAIAAISLCRRPPDCLLIAGEGPSRAKLEALCNATGQQSRVRFLGQLDDVLTVLHAADLFLFPSQSESFGCALAQAMACGLPCLTLRPDNVTIRNANSELIEHGASGFLIDTSSPAHWAQAIDRLADDSNLRSRLGAAATTVAASRFDWPPAYKLMGDLVTSVVTQSRNQPRVPALSPTGPIWKTAT